MKLKQPEERHPLYLAAQTPPHVPGPPGQVLLQSFNHVPQNAGDPAADAGSIEKTATDRTVATSGSAISINRIVFFIEPAYAKAEACHSKIIL